MELSPLETAGHLWKLEIFDELGQNWKIEQQTWGYRDITSSV